jgi:hypothetical protein
VISEAGLIGGFHLGGGIPLEESPGVIVPFMIEGHLLEKEILAIHDLLAGRVRGGMKRRLTMEKPTHLGV